MATNLNDHIKSIKKQQAKKRLAVRLAEAEAKDYKSSLDLIRYVHKSSKLIEMKQTNEGKEDAPLSNLSVSQISVLVDYIEEVIEDEKLSVADATARVLEDYAGFNAMATFNKNALVKKITAAYNSRHTK